MEKKKEKRSMDGWKLSLMAEEVIRNFTIM